MSIENKTSFVWDLREIKRSWNTKSHYFNGTWRDRKANVKGTPEYFEVSLLIRRTLSRPTECSDFSAWVDFRLRTSATAYSLKQKMSCFVKMHVEKRTVIEPSHFLRHLWITCVWKNFRLFWRLRHLKFPRLFQCQYISPRVFLYRNQFAPR